jgi:hypothetical protein
LGHPTGTAFAATGANGEGGCGGLTGLTPLELCRRRIVDQAGKMTSALL